MATRNKTEKKKRNTFRRDKRCFKIILGIGLILTTIGSRM